jgi:hypothetical protein
MIPHRILPNRKLEKTWNISEIRCIYPRKYVYRYSALELILAQGKSVLLNFQTPEL